MQFLKQSTASQVVILGPFLDDTDFKTAETGLTIAATDIKIKKGGATADANKNSGGATHIANGFFYATLDATDTDTVGRTRISVNMAGALPVWEDFTVLEEVIYDALFAASAAAFDANQRVAVGSWLSTAVTANDIAIKTALAKTTHITGFNDVSTSQVNTEVDTALSDINLDHLVKLAVDTDLNTTVHDNSALGYLLAISDVAAFDRTTDSLQANVDTAASVTDIAAAVWDALVSGITTSGSIGKRIIDYLTGDIFARLGAPAGASVSVDVAAVKVDTAAVKTKTDQLTFTVANQLDSNVKGISDDSTAADKLEGLMDGALIVQVNGVATTTSIPIDGFTSVRNDQFKGRLITVISDGSYEQTAITAYNHATQTLTVTALTAAPADNVFLVIQ